MASAGSPPPPGRLTRRTLTALVAAAAVLAVVGVGLALDAPPRSTSDRVAQLQSSLRCPTCAAESIRDSQAPIAASMRSEVRDQVAAGRTDAEILDWFEERYGVTVLLSPPLRGVSALVWLLPALILLIAVVGVAVQRRRARPSVADRDQAMATEETLGAGVPRGGRPAGCAPLHADRKTPPPAAALVGSAAAAAVLAVGLTWASTVQDGAPATPAAADMVAAPDRNGQGDGIVAELRTATSEQPANVQLWLALGRTLEQRHRLEEAADAYRRAVAARPGHPTARFLLAFALVRTGEIDEASERLEDLVEDHPEHAEALLLLGTVRRQQGHPAADRTLNRFLAVSPGHPAAPRVRSLLRGGSDE